MTKIFLFIFGINTLFQTTHGFLSPPTSSVRYDRKPLFSYAVRETALNEVMTSELLNNIKEHTITQITAPDDFATLVSTYTDGHVSITHTHPLLTQKLLDIALNEAVDIDISRHPFSVSDAVSVVVKTLFFLPFMFIGFQILSFLVRNLRKGSGQNQLPMSGVPFLQSPWDRIKKPSGSTIGFDDWAGSPELLRECSEIVSFLKNATAYETIGAKIPHGVLLEGPPGTGKTLLAKAIAGEADASFFAVSASEFVELFVGLGASRVRTLFKQAREQRPSIIFIDEIDAVGRQRGAGINMGNDEREQTLNQLLAEMDGFKENDNILVIAATNRRDVLDTALLRPGRFDRVLTIPLPDMLSRQKILEVHAQKKAVDDAVDFVALARQTVGYSGAQLQNLMNEAAILAVRLGLSRITSKILDQTVEKLAIGVQKENDSRTHETKQRVAIHEAGHAAIVLAYSEYFDLVKVTIQSTYSGAGGYTLFYDKPEIIEHGLYTKDYLKKRLRVALAGRAAESIYYGDDYVSVGAIEDLKQVNTIARKMISQFGMGEQIENYNSPNQEDTPFLGKMIGTGQHVSEELASTIDREVLTLIKEAYHETKRLLKKNEELVKKIIDGLLISTTLSGSEIPSSP